jgi:hypothetical protein
MNLIFRIAKALLEKETIDLTDIIELIGNRPSGFPQHILDYLKEIEERKAHKKFEKELNDTIANNANANEDINKVNNALSEEKKDESDIKLKH